MKSIRTLTAAALFAALFVLVLPVHADCGDGDPTCILEPPISVEIRTASTSGDASATAAESSALTPLDFTVPMPLPRRVEALSASAYSEPESTDSIPDFTSLSIPLRYQTAGDVSCGVQALGMALDGINGSAPTSSSILGFLQDQGMMYNFGTGVEELAHAAQNFGYASSLPFHGWSRDQLMATLAEGNPVVVALGANGADQPGHFVTVTGVSPDGRWVTYNDPTLGKQVIPIDEFKRLWGLQGNSGVAVAEAIPIGVPINYAPLVALAAGLMALVSTPPLALQRKGIGGVLPAPSGGSNSSAPPYPAPAGYKWAKKTVTKYDWKNVEVTEQVEVPNMVRTWAVVRVNRWIEKVPIYKTVKVDRGHWAYRTVNKYRTERYRTTPRYRVKKSYWYRRNGRFYRGTRYEWKTRTVVKTRRVSYTKRERYWVPKIVQEQRFVHNREIEHRDPVYGWRNEKHGTKTISVKKTVPKWMPVGTQVKWELEKLPVPPKPEPDYSYEKALLQNRTENYLSQQAQLQTSDEPVFESVPSFFSDPLGWLQTSLINLGRQNETAQDVMEATLAPAAEWLQTIPNSEEHSVLAWVHHKSNEAIKGWSNAYDSAIVLFDYTLDAIGEGRWGDVVSVAEALSHIPGDLTDAIIRQYDDLPLLAQIGVSIAPGGDAVDIVREARNVASGEPVDKLVLGLSLFGLLMDLGWADGIIPDPADGGNAGAAFLKVLLKNLDDGPAREAVEQMLKNPDEWGTVVEAVQALMKNYDELKVLDDPELIVWLLQKGPDTVKTVAMYGDEATEVVHALRAGERLADVGSHADEASDLISTILDASIHGSGDRAVIGRFFESADDGYGYMQEVAQNGGIFFQTPDGLYDALKNNRSLMEEVNKQYLRRLMDNGVSRIELVGETIGEVFGNPARAKSFTAVELTYLAEEAHKYGYILVGNAWVLP